MSTDYTMAPASDPAATVDDHTAERDPTEDLQGYALAFWEYGQMHDDPSFADAARYALRRAGE